MGKRRATDEGADWAELVREIAADAGALVEQQFRLMRSEVGEELGRAGAAAVGLGAGAGLVAAGGALSALALVHALHERTRWPLWRCYGLVGGVLGAVGAGLLAAGLDRAADVRLLPPPQSAEALRENLAWLKEQVS